MKYLIFRSIFILFIIIISPHKIYANTLTDVYLSDFYSKSDKAGLILKEIETNLKDGSRKNLCSKQREAAKLGLLANKSLIKAFETQGLKPPTEIIRASQQRWESILNECWKNKISRLFFKFAFLQIYL